MKVKCKATSLDRFAEPAQPASPFGRDSDTSSCYFNRLYNEVDEARSSSSQGDLSLDVESLVQELNHERQLRRNLERKLKDTEDIAQRHVADLEADLLETQDQLTSCEQMLRMSQTARASIEVEKQTLLLSLQETTDERFSLEQKLHEVTDLHRVSLDGQDGPSSLDTAAGLVRSHSADMLTPMHSNCAVRRRDDSAYKGFDKEFDSPPGLKRHSNAVSHGMYTQVVELQQENEQLTYQLVHLKMTLAEAAEKELVDNHEIAALRDVNYKLAKSVETLLTR